MMWHLNNKFFWFQWRIVCVAQKDNIYHRISSLVSQWSLLQQLSLVLDPWQMIHNYLDWFYHWKRMLLLLVILNYYLLFLLLDLIHWSIMLPDMCYFNHLQKCHIHYKGYHNCVVVCLHISIQIVSPFCLLSQEVLYHKLSARVLLLHSNYLNLPFICLVPTKKRYGHM